ncbi:thiamine biosynthesis protein ThiS [Halobacteroides halobius DSM 5150]|uniref:Thiamine biosynthesis protein ThiS n=1 Tax=Halobacteroides halobius (strain ATCC 35273 / DSM 5150 / MD-1) TaxID=748449 RepID=L0KDQ9_HALHC|nr:sulfur carrier protein ThiS [Halobacteroides halobius]AGB42218.1 thiamine biosynthesis protein ThiS [Halobacteroides halobius DSM 5150]
MKIEINGNQVEFNKELTVTELLEDQDVDMPDMVSVQLNGEILARDSFEDTVVTNGDEVEFLYFMGGGALV